MLIGLTVPPRSDDHDASQCGQRIIPSGVVNWHATCLHCSDNPTIIYEETETIKWCVYCTISTECSQGVTRDAREHYLTVFTGEIWP